MTTGAHTVRDIYCVKCGTTLGWKYVRHFSHPLRHSTQLTFTRFARSLLCCVVSPFDRITQEHAYEDNQKYKEGKYILERNLLTDVQ